MIFGTIIFTGKNDWGGGGRLEPPLASLVSATDDTKQLIFQIDDKLVPNFSTSLSLAYATASSSTCTAASISPACV